MKSNTCHRQRFTDDRTLRSVLRSCIDLATTTAYIRPWNPPRVRAPLNSALDLRSNDVALGTATNAPLDFDFAVGDWQVKHRRLQERLVGCTDWVEFDGEMSTRKVLGGFGNVEDNLLHLPEKSYRALALRSFDPQSGKWSIWWLDARVPGQIDVPVVGAFEGGIGTFYADDTLNGAAIRIRFNWFAMDPANPRWEQAFSDDAGKSWETNWTMDFRRAGALP